ncbi:MAG: GAF domain-containing protein [Chloroflexi bacterium]|nr:GAF domain-containing protein [Chloroflexota bacterium]
MPGPQVDALLTVAQAATLLGVHPNTLRSWTDAGRLVAYRINERGDRRYRRSEVMRLLVTDGLDDAGDDAGSAGLRPALHAEAAAPATAGELAIFGRIATALATTPTAGAVAAAVIGALRAELGIARAAVYVATDAGASLIAHAGYRRPPPPTRDLPATARSDDGDGRVLRLLTRGRPVGVLVLDDESGARLRPAFVRSLVATLATSLSTAALIGRARGELKRSRALRTVVKELTGTLELGSVLGDIVNLTRTLFEADKAGLWLIAPGTHPFQLAAHHNLGEGFLEAVGALTVDDTTLGHRAVAERRTVVGSPSADDPATAMQAAMYAAEGIATGCLVPLIAGDEVLGVLGLYHQRPRTWPAEELTLVRAFADQAAVAIQNARLYRSVAEQAARMRSIQDLSARLNRLTDARAIARAIVTEASSLAQYHDIRVYAIDWERRMCDPIAFTREMFDATPEEAEDLLRVAVGEGFTGWVAEHGEPLLINDALDDGRGKTIEGTDDIPESMLLVPMMYEGRALGVIVLSQLGYNRFTDDDLQTMNIFAGYAAQAIANATTYEQLLAQSTELKRRADSQRRLLETNERLLSTLDQADVLETIADGLRDVVTYDNLSIYRTDHAARVMHPVLTRERHADEVSRYVIPFGSGLMGWAVEHRQPILANDALSDPRALQIPGTPADPEAVVVVPLMAEGEVIGALNVSRVGGPEVYFSDSDFELVQLFAVQASIALRNADEHHAVSKLADTDALTGLANHGAFQRDLATRISDAEDEAFSVLMMDLDRFKTYNDRRGHPAGDDLLHRVAMAIYGAARSDDHVYRYGGDEFALILPGATSEQAARAGDRVRRAVASLTEGQPLPVTLTVGVAAYPDDAADRAGLIAAADSALYYGKRSGADRVVRAAGLAHQVDNLRGTLEEIAEAALREEDGRRVEHLVGRAVNLPGTKTRHDASVRDALLAVTRSFEAGEADDPGRLDRVGRLAGAIAERMRLGSEQERCIELAARLRSLADEGVAELKQVGSLRDVAAVITGYRRLAGGDRPRGRRATLPVGAHVLAVAAAYDELVAGGPDAGLGRAEAIDRISSASAGHPTEVVAALAAVVDHRPDVGRRRRRADGRKGELGAA